MSEEVRKLLIVEDDPGLRKQLRWCFEHYELLFAEDRAAALAEVRRHEPAVVLQDLGLPPEPEAVTEGLATLEEILAFAPNTKVIVVTGNGDQQSAIRSVGMGAYDFYQKPLDTDVLNLIIRRAFHIHDLEAQNRRLAEQESASPLSGFIAVSEPMLRVCRLVEKVAPTTASVLLLGESGTGKEVLARALHTLSPRAEERFVAINCAAIPDTLLESELFGYEKGAFTGATRQTPGKIETAEGGTLFLDEIGDMPLALQAKLLRFLQERVVERLGGREEIPVDVRVICATNQNLLTMSEEGGFRQDLYYRISEVTVDIPPVRDRAGDKIVLAKALLLKAAERHSKPVKRFTQGALKAIENWNWPGNVREMENKINSSVIMCDGPQVTEDDLSLGDGAGEGLMLNLRQIRENAERGALLQAIAISDGNVSKAADLLGITRPTLYSLANKLDMNLAKN